MSELTLGVGAGLALAGGLGALVKSVIEDNAITLPRLSGGKLFLGELGSILIGGTAGYLVDHSFLTAFFAGYVGFSAIEALLPKTISAAVATVVPPATIPIISTTSVEGLIRSIAKSYEVDPDLAVRVAKCESGLKTNARNVNATGSVDRGLYQINSYWHPDVSDAQADDPEFAIKWFCEAVKAGKISMWSASQKCWDLDKK